MHTRRIMKFGGSSVANADCFKKVAEIIAARIDQNPVIVLSAIGSSGDNKKITDLLKEAVLAATDRIDPKELLDEIAERHFKIINDLDLERRLIQPEIEKLRSVIESFTAFTCSSIEEKLDHVMGFGEIFSAKMMASYLAKLGYPYKIAFPERYGFITTHDFQNADILEESLPEIAMKIISDKDLLIFPGYIGVTKDGKPTTLGRGGSDYTAAILGAALKRDVEIWTDVDGIYRISPKYLSEHYRAWGHPETIPELSYEEAFQMAAFGSKVLYEKSLHAVYQAVRKGKHIRLIIKNTFNPDHPGTIICSRRQQDGQPRGITCLEGTNLLNVYPRNSAEAEKLKAEIAAIKNLKTVLSSETWGRISLVFDKYDPELSKIEQKYESHLSREQVLIKIVGDGLGDNPRMLSKIHSALRAAENPEKYGMNIVHKSPQLLTDDTFEFLVKKRGFSDIVLNLYKALFMEKTITVGLMGMGTVGSGVLRYTSEMYSPEKGGFNFSFPTILVRDISKKREHPEASELTTDHNKILDDPMVDIVVELMGGIEPSKTYVLEALKKGKDVVTANKALLAECGAEIFEAAWKYGRNLGFEASVCAEIPIIDDFLTFPGLSDISGIEGIVNGTSNYVLSRFMEGMPIEEAIKIAQEKGFAEADPFMDISGTDASQKLSILASILFNQPVDYKKIFRQGLEGLLPVDRAAFERFRSIIKPLAIAKIMDDKLMLSVSPALVPSNHPLSSVRDENNALSLYLKGREEPITKIGKGAGAIPTARSVVRDILDVSRKSRAYMVELPGFFRSKQQRPLAPSGDFESSWYVRFTVKDVPGVFGRIATILGDFDLSIHHVMQEELQDEKKAHMMFMLKNAKQEKLEKSLDIIDRLPFLIERFTCMKL